MSANCRSAWRLGLPMNDHFLNIRICHIHSVSYSNIEYIRIWQISYQMSHILAQNWMRYQPKYEFVPFLNTHWHADFHSMSSYSFWLISWPITNGFCIKLACFEGMNMKNCIFEYWIFVLKGKIFEYSNFIHIQWKPYSWGGAPSLVR